MKKVCSIIYNPNSSGVNGTNVIENMKKILEPKFEVKTFKSDKAGLGSEYVKEANKISDLIISIGGDGTFNDIIRGIYGEEQKALLSHIPMGTVNDLGKTFNLSSNPIEALKQILDGKETNLDVLTINDIPYAYVAAFGYLTYVSSETPEQLKKAIKKSAYIVYGGKKALQKPEVYNIKYKIENKEYNIECILGAISSSKGFAGLELYNNFKLNDGKFEVMFVPNLSKLDILKILKEIVIDKKTIPDIDKIIYHKTNNIKLCFDNIPTDDWTLDGEKYKMLKEVEIKVGKQIKMLLPKETVDTLCK